MADSGFVAAFLLITLVTLGGAMGVILSTDVIRSAFFLSASFLGISGYYFLLHADFIGAVQVMVYAGAVTVLILFAVMLTVEHRDSIWHRGAFHWVVTSLTSLALLAVLVFSLGGVAAWPTQTGPAPNNSTALIGKALLGPYLVPFEVVSLVLLVAMVGVIVLARKEVGDK